MVLRSKGGWHALACELRPVPDNQRRGYWLTDPRLWLLVGTALLLGCAFGVRVALWEEERPAPAPVVPAILFRVGPSEQPEPLDMRNSA